MGKEIKPASLKVIASIFLLPWIYACTAASNLVATSSSSNTSTNAVASPAPGVRAARIIFQNTAGGSFNAPSSSSGTFPNPGSGLQAVRIFKPDGSLLASSTSSSNWPAWLVSFEIGLSGTANTSAPSRYCANFSDINEATSLTNCRVGPGPTPTPGGCGAPQGQFRVSEFDCVSGTTPIANGGPQDGVYMRAQFSRDPTKLGSSENILVVIEYSAASLNPAPVNPTNCYFNSKFAPEYCSDFSWKAFLKHGASEIVQPYMLIAPPFHASAITAGQASMQNAGIASTKQFILPLASDIGLTHLQISRIPNPTFVSPSTDMSLYCANNASTGNSPLCSGMVFYSITFYRI